MISIFNFLFKRTKCTHEKITVFDNGKYCPDCGNQITIKWYLLRCSCCNSKRKGYLNNKKVLPLDKFCTNCGENSYYLEQINKPNYFEISYAIAVKDILQNKSVSNSNTKVWIDKEDKFSPEKLIPILHMF